MEGPACGGILTERVLIQKRPPTAAVILYFIKLNAKSV